MNNCSAHRAFRRERRSSACLGRGLNRRLNTSPVDAVALCPLCAFGHLYQGCAQRDVLRAQWLTEGSRGSTEPPCSQGCPSIPEGARPALVHTLLLKPRSPKAEENCPPPGDTSTGWQCWEAAGGSTVPGTVRPCRSSAPWIPRLMPELSHLSSSSLPTVPRTGRTSSISDKGLGLWVLPEAAV